MGNDTVEASWTRNPFVEYYMLFIAIIGFILFLTLLYLSYGGNFARAFRVSVVAYPATMIVIYIAVRSNQRIPREFKLSKEGLFMKFRKEVKSYLWQDIADVSIQKVRLFEVLLIELADGKVDQISSLTRKSRQNIMSHYRKLKTHTGSQGRDFRVV